MSTKKKTIISLGILLVAVLVTSMIFWTEPTAQSEGATKEMAMLVEVESVNRGNYHPEFVSTGTVSPVEDVVLSPLVGGQVVRRSPAFSPGGYVEEGTVLLQIDPSDYENNLALRKSELSQAQTNLDVELGRQEVAKKDLALIGGDSLTPEEISLVLRKPQLNAVKANIEAARAAVSQAKLELARTTIRAPFDAHILSQNVTEGSQVAPGDNLGRLVGAEQYWVTLSIPVSKLQWLKFPDQDEQKGAPVLIQNESAWTSDTYRKGYLKEQIGALDDQTRLARVLVAVPDPLAQDPERQGKPELMIGSFVEAHVQGEELKDVVRLPRAYVRNNNSVWVMEDGKLSIREVEIVVMDSEYAYISKGLEDQDRVVITNLSTVTEGVALRIKNDSVQSEKGNTSQD